MGGKVDYGKLIQSFCDYQKLSGSAVARICVLQSWILQSVNVLLHNCNLILLLPFGRPFPGNPEKCFMPVKDLICYCSFVKLLLAVINMHQLQCQIHNSDLLSNFCMWYEIQILSQVFQGRLGFCCVLIFMKKKRKTEGRNIYVMQSIFFLPYAWSFFIHYI